MWFFKKRNRIASLGRSGIEFVEDGKVLRIDAEFASEPLMVVINGKLPLAWKPPHDQQMISEMKHSEILSKTVNYFESRGYLVDLRS